jgi:hypothetical protein
MKLSSSFDYFSNVIIHGKSCLSAACSKKAKICNELVYFLFICGLVNDAVSISDYAVSNDLMTATTEFERIWKAAFMA